MIDWSRALSSSACMAPTPVTWPHSTTCGHVAVTWPDFPQVNRDIRADSVESSNWPPAIALLRWVRYICLFEINILPHGYGRPTAPLVGERCFIQQISDNRRPGHVSPEAREFLFMHHDHRSWPLSADVRFMLHAGDRAWLVPPLLEFRDSDALTVSSGEVLVAVRGFGVAL